MTGAYLRVKRDGWENVEIEHLTDKEREDLFQNRPEELLKWLNFTCKFLAHLERGSGMKMKKLTQEQAFKILEDMLKDLGCIAPEDMTTFELNFLRRVATNPPESLPHRGIEEEKILQ